MTEEFITHFTAAMDENPDVEPELARRAVAIINGRKGIRRTLILHALETHARQLGAAAQGVPIEAVDLSKIDWMAILGTILRILIMFAPFLI